MKQKFILSPRNTCSIIRLLLGSLLLLYASIIDSKSSSLSLTLPLVEGYNVTPSLTRQQQHTSLVMSTSDHHVQATTHPGSITARSYIHRTSNSVLEPPPLRQKQTILALSSSSSSMSTSHSSGNSTSNNLAQSTTASADQIFTTENHQQQNTNKNQVPSATFNLIKAIIGSGVLALPSGVAAMSDHKITLVPAIALIAALGGLSAYTFGLYGRLLESTKSKSLGEIWEKEKGESSAWIVSMASMTFCYGAALSYSILLGDTIPALVQATGLKSGTLATSRSLWIVLLTTFVLRPLCNLKSLASLAPISIVGVVGVIATACFLGWRCPNINAASPYNAASSIGAGGLLSTLSRDQVPSFGTYSTGLFSPSSLILMGMAATAFLGHFSVAKFHQSLTSRSGDVSVVEKSSTTDTSNGPLDDFFKVTLGGFGGVTVINCLIMAFGFLTFGGNSKGVILNNFSTLDPGASLCRLLMAICVIGGYPFVFSTTLSEALELLQRVKPTKVTTKSANKQRPLSRIFSGIHNVSETTLSRILLISLAGLALVMKNAGFVVGLNGALMGSAMIYIFPSLLFLKQTSKQMMKSSPLSSRTVLERNFCRFLVGFGVLAAVAGGGGLVMNTYFPELL